MPSTNPSPESSCINAEWARSTASVRNCCTSGLPITLVKALSTNDWAPAVSVGANRSRLLGSTLVTRDSTSMAVNTSLVTHVASPAVDFGVGQGGRHDVADLVAESNTVALAHTPISASVRHDHSEYAADRRHGAAPAGLVVRTCRFEHYFFGHVGGHPDSFAGSPMRRITRCG